jgi:hypothetical protein
MSLHPSFSPRVKVRPPLWLVRIGDRIGDQGSSLCLQKREGEPLYFVGYNLARWLAKLGIGRALGPTFRWNSNLFLQYAACFR